MAVSPGREITIVLNTANNQISVITNSNEKVNANTVQLPDTTESMIAQNASLGYAAFRNAGGGQVLVLDLANIAVLNTLAVTRAHRMVMNPAGTKVLVFSDSYACTGNGTALTVMDLTVSPPALTTVCGFNEAVWGVFSSDSTTAYIMNCGPECGASGTASVAVLNMTSATVTSTTPLTNAGATVGFLNGTNLYVAGTLNGTPGAGTLTTLNVSSGVPVPSTPVHISDGYHSLMVLGANNKLFTGSSLNCTNSGLAGCLSIFDASAGTAIIDTPKGMVSSMVPIAGRNAVYVIEGGVLRVYDTTTSQESVISTVNITGQVVDVKAVDQPQ
jgi:hypothetical protein